MRSKKSQKNETINSELNKRDIPIKYENQERTL